MTADQQGPDVAAYIRALNDDADPLHLDITPAVYALSAIGLRAVGPLLDVLDRGDEMTRLRAQRALEGILNQRHGFHAGRGFPSAVAEDALRAEWKANGNYDYASDAAVRAASIMKWRQWLTTARD